jgi:hypothetical protein
MRHRGRYHMCWLTRTKGEPELRYCPPVDGLRAPGYVRCGAPAGKDATMSTPMAPDSGRFCGCSGQTSAARINTTSLIQG